LILRISPETRSKLKISPITCNGVGFVDSNVGRSPRINLSARIAQDLESPTSLRADHQIE
jgi:hypothetical protein